MARRPRIFAPGLLYHVIARGNRREAVFLTQADYEAYLHQLAAYRTRYAVTLYAYCLMPNHVHLVVRTADAPLDRFMQGLQQSYTQAYNRRHGQVGHVFQGRYKALICGTDESLLTLVRYVHLNPVQAGLVGLDLVDPTLVLRLVGGASGYVRLVANELEGKTASAPAQARVWSPSVEPAEPRPAGPPKPREPVERALNCLARELRVDVEALRGPDRSRPAYRARALAAYVLVRGLGYRLTDVAASLRRDGSTTSILVRRLGRHLPSDPATAQEVEGLVRAAEVKVKA
jgi:putative transposase